MHRLQYKQGKWTLVQGKSGRSQVQRLQGKMLKVVFSFFFFPHTHTPHFPSVPNPQFVSKKSSQYFTRCLICLVMTISFLLPLHTDAWPGGQSTAANFRVCWREVWYYKKIWHSSSSQSFLQLWWSRSGHTCTFTNMAVFWTILSQTCLNSSWKVSVALVEDDPWWQRSFHAVEGLPKYLTPGLKRIMSSGKDFQLLVPSLSSLTLSLPIPIN